MKAVGRIESVWRYPVKSMPGESLREAYVSFAGVLGDRLYAVYHAGAPKGFRSSPHEAARKCCDFARGFDIPSARLHQAT